jgi:von Willebrand factor type A domain
MSLTRSFLPILSITLCLILSVGSAAAQQPHLNFADPVKMLDCMPVSPAPCFSASFNIMDEHDQLVGVDLGSNLLSRVKITADNENAKVFYAAGGAAQSKRSRITMILVDISGSMAHKLPTQETRFQAARSALSQFLYDFRDGVDQVAIVPFESHNVVSTIQSATFAETREQANEQAQALPLPRPQNNTALFSAVSTGLEALKARKQLKATDVDTLLIVMTDGTNDVRPGDDAGLLAGIGGLTQVHSDVAQSKIEVIAIGFGDPAEIDQHALAQLSTRRPYMASDADGLNKAFSMTRRLLTDRIQVAFLTSWTNAASLAGKSIALKATLDLPDGRTLTSNDGRVDTPQLGPPVPFGKAGPELLKGLGALGTAPAQTTWVELLRPIFVFFGLGIVLLIAWFWVPRLIWPGQYMGAITLPKSTMKWSGMTQVKRSPPGVRAYDGRPSAKAPPGFEPENDSPARRTPRDATIVQPMGEATRIRLDKDQK